MKKITLEINGVLFDKLTVAENYNEMLIGQEKKTQMERPAREPPKRQIVFPYPRRGQSE